MHRLEKITSGGQTGVDRAALEAARRLGIPHGGWCPAGRRAEDGPIAACWNLRETESTAYDVRTRRNVEEADAVLILTPSLTAVGGLSPGTALTIHTARRLHKPLHLVDLTESPSVEGVRLWLAVLQVKSLNLAGPRESQSPGIYLQALHFLLDCFEPHAPSA